MNQNEQIFELEKHLHEGYVVNNNAKAGFLASLIAAIVGAIGVYGYVFAHTVPWFSTIGEPYYISEHMFTMDVLVMAMLACQFVLVVLYSISCSLGVTQRLEQFITFAIRCKVYENKSQTYKDIFPEKYCPFWKKGDDIIIGVFGKICCVLKAIFVIVTLLTFIKVFIYIGEMKAWTSIVWFVIGIMGTLLMAGILCCIFDCYVEKYNKRERAYLKKGIMCPFLSQQISKEICQYICFQDDDKQRC